MSTKQKSFMKSALDSNNNNCKGKKRNQQVFKNLTNGNNELK